MQPIVAVVADIREFENYSWHCVPDQYMTAAFNVSGVLPLLVPAFGDDIDFDALLARVDGVMLSGSKSNVHPSNFGVEAHEKYEPYDTDRDATSLPLIRAAIEKGVPLFAICRGIQELNVALGGTLATEIQEADGMMDHRAPSSPDQAERFALAHSVKTKPGSCIEKIIGGDVRVNSLHRQAIDNIAPRLQVEASADDGTVEAVSVIDAKGYAVGVQWHPEYWAKTDDTSRRLFEAFGDAVRDYASQKMKQDA
jgi:putative glutamine amidotransferase